MSRHFGMQMRVHLIGFGRLERATTSGKRTLRLSFLLTQFSKTALQQMGVHFERRKNNGAAQICMRALSSNLLNFTTRKIVRKEIVLGERLIVYRATGIRFAKGGQLDSILLRIYSNKTDLLKPSSYAFFAKTMSARCQRGFIQPMQANRTFEL